MGLDQYWLFGKTKEEKVEATLLNKDPDDCTVFHQHRKWHELNDFMSRYYDGDMNCINLPINDDILDELHEWAYDFVLSDARELEAWDREKDAADLITAIDEIRQALAQGRDVFYHPWW